MKWISAKRLLIVLLLLQIAVVKAEDIPIEKTQQKLLYNFQTRQICFEARYHLINIANNIGVRFTSFLCDYRGADLEYEYYQLAESSEILGNWRPYQHTLFLQSPYCYQIAESISFFLNSLPLQNFSSSAFCNPGRMSSLIYQFDYLEKKVSK